MGVCSYNGDSYCDPLAYGGQYKLINLLSTNKENCFHSDFKKNKLSEVHVYVILISH